MKYIIFIRGVNVSGKNKLKMADFREALIQKNSIDQIESYIQSGNLFVVSSESTEIIHKEVTDVLKSEFDIETSLMVISEQDYQTIFNLDPMAKKEIQFRCVVFADNKIVIADMDKLNNAVDREEAYLIQQDKVYLYLPYGSGRTKLNNNFFEKLSNQNCTTRNWKTICKMQTYLS